MNNTKFSGKHLMRRFILGSLLGLCVIIPFNEGGNGYILQLITQLVLLVCGIAWGLQVIHGRKLFLKYDWIDMIVLGGVAWIGVSLAISDYRYATIFEGLKVLSYVAIWYLSRILFSSKKIRGLVLFAIIVSGLIQFLIAVYNALITNMMALQAGFVNPNNLAAFFVMGLSIALSFLLFRQHPPSHSLKSFKSLLQRRFQLINVVVCLVIICFGMGIILIQSRGAIISLAVTSLLITTLKKKRAGLILFILLTIIIFLPLPHGSLAERLRKRDDPFAYQRIDLWKSSLRMAAGHPIFGVGLGMFKYYGPIYNFPVEHQVARYGKRLDMAHNDILQISAELGVIGILLFAGGLIRLGYIGLHQLRSALLSWQSMAASAGIISILVHGLVSNLLISPAIAITTVLLVSVLFDDAKSYRRTRRKFMRTKGNAWSGYLFLGILVTYLLVPVIGYPFLGHVHVLKYQQLRQKGQIAGAVTHLQSALKYVPIQAYYHYTLGQLYATAFRNQPNLDAYYEGYRSLTQAIHYNPHEAQFYMSLAELHREMYRQKLPTAPAASNALREYKRALEVEPFNPFMRASLATLYADVGEFKQAIRILQKAIEDEPNFVRGHQLLGEFYSHLKQESEAHEAFSRAEEILQAHPFEREPDYIQALLQPLRSN